MSRIGTRFASLGEEGRTALLSFITAGDPAPELTVPLMHALAAAGADVIELGVPFSDPQADGPIIQRASERALAHRMSLRGVLELVREFRQTDKDTPVLLMGYLNPIEIMGYEAFAEAAASAGVDAVLTVDLPPEEAAELTALLRERGLDSIFLAAPTSTPQRLERICNAGSGFIYYVSLKGVTGSAKLSTDVLGERIVEIRRHTNLPIAIGFGVKDADSARRLARLADGVVVGSAIIEQIEQAQAEGRDVLDAAGVFVQELRSAVDEKEARQLAS
jgi:tryptophan synthase alpha chain